jgi:hypothetical protein
MKNIAALQHVQAPLEQAPASCRELSAIVSDMGPQWADNFSEVETRGA